MKYILNGVSKGSAHAGQIAHSEDNINWSYYTKIKIREISGYMTTVRLHFDNDSKVEILLTDLLNQPAWNTGDPAGLNQALEDLSGWLLQDSPEVVVNMLTDIRKYQFAVNGSTIIQAANGLVNGNWYAVRFHADTVLSNLTEKGANLIGNAIPAGFVYPERNIRFSSDLSGNGFTAIQVTSGTVEAYIK